MKLLSTDLPAIAEAVRDHREVSTVPSPNFPAAVNKRLEDLSQYPPNIAHIAIDDAALHRTLRQASNSTTTAKRVMWLRSAAHAFTAPVLEAAACQPSCSHCCHIPVHLTEREAFQIGREIDVIPAPWATVANLPNVEPSYKNPCSFLKNSRCSIYEHRPLVCRTHLNLDRDSLLCELVDGVAIPVPYLNAIEMGLATLSLLDTDHRIADIRHWFAPPPVAENQEPRT